MSALYSFNTFFSVFVLFLLVGGLLLLCVNTAQRFVTYKIFQSVEDIVVVVRLLSFHSYFICDYVNGVLLNLNKMAMVNKFGPLVCFGYAAKIN